MIVTKSSPVVFLALLAAGCGGGMHGVAGEQKTICAAGSQQAVSSRAAVVMKPTNAFRAPGKGLLASFDLRNVNGARTVFGVVGRRVDSSCRATWLHVQLPVRPNGSTGWVRADRVETWPVHTRLVVDLSERHVRLYDRGRLVVDSIAAIGSDATPTPLGHYYVNQRLVPAEKGGPFGPGAVGISAFSPVLTGWAQGGPIAIHGTNQPWSIGQAVSNGCIRLPNAVLTRLFDRAVAGTPVLIKK